MKLNAFWTGSDLSYLEQLCLRSALEVGHEIDLWSYGAIGNVPAGIRLRDASEVMPQSMCVWNKRAKSFGVGADIFRILLQKQNRGCYIDCDLLFLKPMTDSEYIFGEDGKRLVNNAVLKLPPDSPVIDPILKLATSDLIVPPWWPLQNRIKQRLKALIGYERKIDDLPWVALGPAALTHFLNVHGLRDKALPYDVFYPIPSKRAAEFFTPGAAVRKDITDRTITVHLWHQRLRAFKEAPPPVDSFIYEHCVRLGIAAEPKRLSA